MTTNRFNFGSTVVPPAQGATRSSAASVVGSFTFPNKPQCSSGISQSKPYLARPVKGEESAGQHAQKKTVAAGGNSGPEKVESVKDAPASIFNRREADRCLHREKASSDALAETKRVIPNVIAASEQAAQSIERSTRSTPAISVEERLIALRDRLASRGKLRPSKPKPEYRFPYAD